MNAMNGDRERPGSDRRLGRARDVRQFDLAEPILGHHLPAWIEADTARTDRTAPAAGSARPSLLAGSYGRRLTEWLHLHSPVG